MTYSGGYFLINEPIVRGFAHNSHTSSDLSKLSDYTIDSLNHVQATPWTVNPFMMDVISKFTTEGKDVIVKEYNDTNTILRLERPESPKDTNTKFTQEEWAMLDKSKRKAHRKAFARKMEDFEEKLGVYRATKRIIETAEEMSQFEMFYFPHNLDFRLRMYPIPTDLTPQSNDLSKGLLRFYRPTELGKNGYFWLGFSVATHWGEDKLSPKDRFAYANERWFNDLMSECVDDPIRNRNWLSADKPFQFLAAAHEWVWANRYEDPYSFMSHLPGNLDGSCNGAQHLSIMARDQKGATATNCTSDAQRHDLYQAVADAVWEKVQQDAHEGHPMAIEWTPKLQEAPARRKVVKRSVMTVPYGVTGYGVADFMIKDKHVSKEEDGYWDRAKYMRDLILSKIDETLSQGRKLQLYFQACAMICAEAGLPLCWDTPAGSKVTQAYRNMVFKRIRAFDTRYVVYEEPSEEEDNNDFLARVGMDVKKSGTSAPPNVVHSCDAAHLQITVCRMADAGIKDFSMIHDSFGCPMAHVGLMRDILRESVVDMYQSDYLNEWKESVEKYSGLEMPEPPAKGSFNVTEILQSDFFFS